MPLESEMNSFLATHNGERKQSDQSLGEDEIGIV